MKKCPFCAEKIQDEAIKCKHCNEMLAARPSGMISESAPVDPMNTSKFVYGCKKCYDPAEKDRCGCCGAGLDVKLLPMLYCDECAALKSNKCSGCGSTNAPIQFFICTDCYSGECYGCQKKI